MNCITRELIAVTAATGRGRALASLRLPVVWLGGMNVDDGRR